MMRKLRNHIDTAGPSRLDPGDDQKKRDKKCVFGSWSCTGRAHVLVGGKSACKSVAIFFLDLIRVVGSLLEQVFL